MYSKVINNTTTTKNKSCNTIIIIIFCLTLGSIDPEGYYYTYDPEGDEKLKKLIYKLGYDHQSVRSVDGKLSCRRTAL